jgi:hypothetical protein
MALGTAYTRVVERAGWWWTRRGGRDGDGTGAWLGRALAGSVEGFAGGIGSAAGDRRAEDLEEAGGGGTAGEGTYEYPIWPRRKRGARRFDDGGLASVLKSEEGGERIRDAEVAGI